MQAFQESAVNRRVVVSVVRKGRRKRTGTRLNSLLIKKRLKDCLCNANDRSTRTVGRAASVWAEAAPYHSRALLLPTTSAKSTFRAIRGLLCQENFSNQN